MPGAKEEARRVADVVAGVRSPARDAMWLIEKGEIPFIEAATPGPFRLLFTTRFGGVSTHDYAALNLSYWVNDDPALVDRNHALVAQALGWDPGAIVLPWQVHGTEVLELDECRRRGHRVPCDGLILRGGRDCGLAAHMLSGDCLTVVVVGDDTCALIHAGWRGLVASIVELAVKAMEPATPEWAFLGPAIGPCCYEVGDEVAGPVEARFGEAAVVRRCPDEALGRPRLDLWECALVALERSGLPRERVLNPRLCTVCHHDVFYSHRADGPATGRHTAMVWVQE